MVRTQQPSSVITSQRSLDLDASSFSLTDHALATTTLTYRCPAERLRIDLNAGYRPQGLRLCHIREAQGWLALSDSLARSCHISQRPRRLHILKYPLLFRRRGVSESTHPRTARATHLHSVPYPRSVMMLPHLYLLLSTVTHLYSAHLADAVVAYPSKFKGHQGTSNQHHSLTDTSCQMRSISNRERHGTSSRHQILTD